MEGAFALAKKTYRDNFLQYKLTNEPKYKNAYEQSMKSIETMLQKLRSKPVETPKELKTKYLKEEDSLRGALLRTQTQSQLPSMSWRYITLGSLSIVVIGLMAF